MVSWEEATRATVELAKAQVGRNQLPEVTEYIHSLCIEGIALEAAIEYAQWSAAAEYRVLSRQSLVLDKIPYENIKSFFGGGTMPETKEVRVARAKRHQRLLAQWTLGQDHL